MAGISATGALIAAGLHAAAGGSGFSRAVAGTGPVFLAFLAIHVPAGLTAVISGAIAATAPKRHGRHTRADTHQDMSPQAGVLLADLPLQADGPGQQQRHPQFAGLAPPLAAERVRSRGYCRLHQGDIHASLLSLDCDCPGKLSQYFPGARVRLFVLAGDDTLLNTYDYEIANLFGFTAASNAVFVNAAAFPVVFYMPGLVSFAASHGYAVFFITSLGYSIMADFGDQYSDLLGGDAGHQVKIPNPMYYLP